MSLSRLVRNTNQTVLWLCLILLAALPLHAVIVTVFETGTPVLDLLIRSWKELFLGALFALNFPWMLRNKIWRHPVAAVVLVYIGLSILYAVWMWQGMATLVGLRNNVGLMLLFIIGIRLSGRDNRTLHIFEKLIIATGVAVSLSVLAEILWPGLFSQLNLLERSNTGELIQDSTISRLHGFMSGPLQMGSYLVLPFAVTFSRFLKTRNNNYLIYLGLFAVASFLSYSRAAFGALILVVVVQLTFKYKRHLTAKNVGIFILTATISCVATVMLALNFRPLSLLLFHAEPEVALVESSTADHVVYALTGSKMIVAQPLGYGLGAAGPASFFNERSFNPENYFLQIGLEVGLIGLGLFVLILYKTGRKLFTSPKFFSTFIALVAMNLVLHTWTDTATAWTAWTIFGVYIGTGENLKHASS